MTWLKEIPFIVLIGAAVLLAVLPITPEPHLIEKMRMLEAGKLTEWIDMLDVLWHSFPCLLLLLKLGLLIPIHSK